MMLKVMLIAGVVLVTVAGAASGGATAAKQRIAIKGSFGRYTDAGKFTLVPLTAGELKRDSGKSAATANAGEPFIRKGQTVTVATSTDNYETAKGSLYVAVRVEIVDAGGAYRIATGTWTVLNSTGIYAGYRGGGTFTSVEPPKGPGVFREEGYLAKAA
jgi:hypothetical protein